MGAAAGPGSSDPLVGDLRRSGLVTLLVLHFVADESLCGNQLMERISTLTDGAVAVNPNTMYPLLRSLEAHGLLNGRWDPPDRRSRHCYEITAAGAEHRRRLAAQLEPNLDALAHTIDVIRHELLAR
ncbi:MAG TPA: PadR family transcriptional regulator [Solirubrobacteraceae bacterium]|jgi:DNA-binding PadR family transcriptional regulator